jgi:hypothetical protein
MDPFIHEAQTIFSTFLSKLKNVILWVLWSLFKFHELWSQLWLLAYFDIKWWLLHWIEEFFHEFFYFKFLGFMKESMDIFNYIPNDIIFMNYVWADIKFMIMHVFKISSWFSSQLHDFSSMKYDYVFQLWSWIISMFQSMNFMQVMKYDDLGPYVVT